jgi:hypothetical protein
MVESRRVELLSECHLERLQPLRANNHIQIVHVVEKFCKYQTFGQEGTHTMSKKLDYAYAAGLIDGEGTITLTRQGANCRWRRPSVSIPSTTTELLEFMHTTFKGCVSDKRPTKTAETPSKTWTLTYDAAIEFLHLIVPYLKEPEKVRRANLILNEYKKLTPRNGKYTAEQREKKLEFEKKFFESAKRQKNRIRW